MKLNSSEILNTMLGVALGLILAELVKGYLPSGSSSDWESDPIG